MGFGPSQTDYRKFRGHHLHSMAQVTHCFNQASLAGIYDDNIVCFGKCPNHGLHFPPFRLPRAPGIVRQHTNTLPVNELMTQCRSFNTAQRSVYLTETQTRLTLEAKQQIQASRHEIGIDQHAALPAFRECQCKYGSHDAKSHTAVA